MIRIVIPVLNDQGLKSSLSEHFGRAPYFMVVDLDEENNPIEWRAIPNVSEHFGGVGRPPDRILELRPNVLITYGMGPRALWIFQSAGVAVLKAVGRTVEEVLEAFKENRLEELTEGCLHALHR